MFLKSLSMKGFKSFADSTVLEFEPGITIVVGPNGSGKSNVVDAVTWVLGAQGPRALRSGKMEDVIFAGTSTRPALGRAEVSLTIDNTSRKLPVDMAEVTITRTLFRNGESEYAINGSPCRLLDVQDLLSDSGVGRQQHMIIGQGQLDTVLNARPEDRRAVIEEAAGVLKHRRRRERAERRLAGTQENLERLGDLMREVRRQIRPLERQAAAARSYTELSDELHALRSHLAGAELAELTARREAAAAELVGLAGEERQLQVEIGTLDEQANLTAAELTARREEDLALHLGRVQGLVERTRGTAGVLRERQRSLAVALDAAADVDVVSTLEAEAARLAAEVSQSDEEAAAIEPERLDLEQAEEVLRADERAHSAATAAERSGPDPQEALDLALSRQELLRRAATRAAEELDRLKDRIAALEHRGGAVASTIEELDRGAADMEREAEQLTGEAVAAESAARETVVRLSEAQQRADDAERARHRSAARAEALDRALQELLGAGGREVLHDADGVVGSLLDLVEIDSGWEAAFEAAVGASVAAVVVEGRDAARHALGRLRGQGVTGAVLAAAGDGARAGSMVVDPAGLPTAAGRLRDHVVARTPRVATVLDALIGSAVRIDGWEQAIDLALDRPDLVVVTPEGDRFSRSGWRVRSTQGVVTAAAVEEAEQRAVEAAERADRVREELARARAAHDEARQVADDRAKDAYRHEADRQQWAAERSRLADERARVEAELADVRRLTESAAARAASDHDESDRLERSLPELTAAAEASAERAARSAEARRELEERRAALRGARNDIDVRVAGVAERRRVLQQKLREVERRLEGHAEERQAAAARRLRLEADGVALTRLAGVVDAQRARLEILMDDVRRDYQAQVEALRAGGERLEALRHGRADAERRLGVVRERARALEIEVAEAAVRIDNVVDVVRRDLGREPSEVVGSPCPPLPEGVEAAAHATRLAERLASLGPVNPLALEELSALEERQHELESQVNDVRSARRELQEVIRALDEEIMQTFASAAADVNEHFSTLTAMLFPGGTGRMVLTDPEDLLNTGVEIEVRPMGRNVRRVSLLSGGERSLAALAFLFAVFRSRPSPFYLMDEVEAALDDVNLHRFLDLVKQFRDEAQLIIVSHQKRTMETGDALYGVTMAPGGSSQVVSQKVADPAGQPEQEKVSEPA